MDNRERENWAATSAIATLLSGTVQILPLPPLDADLAVDGALSSFGPGVVDHKREIIIEGGKVIYALSSE